MTHDVVAFHPNPKSGGRDVHAEMLDVISRNRRQLHDHDHRPGRAEPEQLGRLSILLQSSGRAV